MGAKVCFHFQIDEKWYGRSRDLQLWRWLFHSMGVEQSACIAPLDDWHEIQRGWNTPPYQDKTILPYLYPSLSAFLEKEEGNFVFTDAHNGFPSDVEYAHLMDYQHPEDIWYVFGPNEGLRPNSMQKREWVCIPQNGEGRISCFHALNAASMVLYDRMAKGGSGVLAPERFTPKAVNATVPPIG